jgi:predicted DNA-binding ArsR family transcriptional regulator
MKDDPDRPLTPQEDIELDAELEAVASLRQAYPLEQLPTGPFDDIIAKAPNLNELQNKPFATTYGLAPRTAVQLIDDALEMLEKSRGLVNTNGEARAYRAALNALQIDRKAAWSAALDVTAPRYVISAQLKSQAGYLRSMHTKLKTDATALATIASALNGVATLIKALTA